MAVGKISGAVGTHAHVPPDLEEEVCAALGLGAAPVSTQIVQRDRHARFLNALALLAGTVEKIATEIRHLQRTEVREAEEPFPEGIRVHRRCRTSAIRTRQSASRVGAAAARICGDRAENIALWHERDISHSSTERVIFPDACILPDFMLADLAEIVDGLVVYGSGCGPISTPAEACLLAAGAAGPGRRRDGSASGLQTRPATCARSWDGGGPFGSNRTG